MATDEGVIRLWDVSTGESIATLTGHTSWVWVLAFSPNGSMLVSGSEEGIVILWDMRKFLNR